MLSAGKIDRVLLIYLKIINVVYYLFFILSLYIPFFRVFYVSFISVVFIVNQRYFLFLLMK